MQTISSYPVKISVNVVNYCTIITWYKIVIDNCFCDGQSSKAELPFFHSARHLMSIDICIKFREYSLSGFQVIERTQFVTDRQTDGRQGKNNMSPDPEGGDIMTKKPCKIT